MGSMANEHAIRGLADQISHEVPELVKSKDCLYKTAYQTKEWTWAVWQFWKRYCQVMSRKGSAMWEMCPRDGVAKGEYLVDFMLFENKYGPRIACESEWG